jgi:hypothetical protein
MLPLLGALPTPAAAQPVAAGRLAGVVFDSTLMQPLADAQVQLLRADRTGTRSTRTDARGRFQVDALPSGTWVVAALHPRLDTLGVEQLSRGVDVRGRGTTRVELAVPALRTMVARVCSRAEAEDSTGYVRGAVRGVLSGSADAGGAVRFTWAELEIGADGVRRSLANVEATVDGEGRYLACGVPPDVPLQVRAWRGADSTGVLEFAMPEGGIAVLDLAVGPAQGAGRVAGRVQQPSGQPLDGARVSVWGSGREVRTGDDGRYDLTGLPLGSYTLDVRAIGFQPYRATVAVRPGDGEAVSVRLERLAMLDTVQVRARRAQRLGPDMVDFERRRRQGFGRFFDGEQLGQLGVSRTSDLFWQVPGVRVAIGGPQGDRLFMRAAMLGSECAPTIFVDGMPLPPEVSLDLAVPPADLRAVEVYTRAMQTPPEFSPNGASGCGAVVVWTKWRMTANGVRR